MKTKRLPNKPSRLLLVALRDLEKVERSRKTYRVEMDGFWHGQDESNKICTVCLAGSVIAKTFRTNAETYKEPWDYTPSIKRKLFALNEARQGFWREFFRALGFSVPSLAHLLPFVPQYNYDPTRFKDALRKAAEILGRAGL